MVSFGFLIGLMALSVFAETQPPTGSGPANVGPGTPSNPSVIQPFDKGFFDEKPDTSDQKTAEGRYKGEATNYNSANREEWLSTCAKLKNKPKAYRECYDQEKRKTLDGLRKKADDVEANQGQNIKNALPMLEDMRKNPSEEED